MDHLKEYILSIIIAATISGVAVKLIGNKGLHKSLIQLLSGLFLLITVISPLIKVKIDDFTAYFTTLEAEATGIITNAEIKTNAAKAEIIKERIEAYILDEATKLGLDLRVDVTLADDSTFLPSTATIIGAAAPYKKAMLQNKIQETLGIPEEKQMWR